MISISYNKVDLVPPIVANPFEVSSVDLKILLPGRIVMVDTGISFVLPDEYILFPIESKRKDLALVSATMHEGRLYVAMSHIGNDDVHFIRPGDKIAKVLIGQQNADVRFIELREGKMVKYGDASSAKE